MNSKLWLCLIVTLVLLLVGCGKEGGENKLEEAVQIYAVQANSPTQIGDMVKTSEAQLVEGLEEMGAGEGKLLEYANETDYVLVMAYRFDNPTSANEAFGKLEGGTEIAPDFYEMERGFYRALISDAIYLASGPRDAVVSVIGGISAAFSESK